MRGRYDKSVGGDQVRRDWMVGAHQLEVRRERLVAKEQMTLLGQQNVPLVSLDAARACRS